MVEVLVASRRVQQPKGVADLVGDPAYPTVGTARTRLAWTDDEGVGVDQPFKVSPLDDGAAAPTQLAAALTIEIGVYVYRPHVSLGTELDPGAALGVTTTTAASKGVTWW